VQEIEAAADDFLTHETDLVAEMEHAAKGAPLDEWCTEQSRAAFEAMQESKREAVEELGMSLEEAEAEFAGFETDIARCAAEAGVDVSTYAANMMSNMDSAMEELSRRAQQRSMSVSEYSATLAKIESGAADKAAALGMTMEQYMAFAWDTVHELRSRPHLRDSSAAQQLQWISTT
jgi:predicted RNase H-like nuclease (RuvC/YqgF family)